MTSISIANGIALTPNGLCRRTITVASGTIESVGEANEGIGAPTIDASGLIVAPGFVDLQINGGFGLDLLTDPGAMWDLGRRLPEHGVTSFLPTIITSPPEFTDRALTALTNRPRSYLGAEPIGLHFEGPMINQRRAGAHRPEHIVAPEVEVVESWSRSGGVVLVTLAPELDRRGQVIGELTRRGVTVAAGHTMATVTDAQAGVAAGVSMVTHLFNAMAPLNHREPNLAGFALAERSLIAGIIVDGVHVHPTTVAAAWNAKGPSGIVLVTDAVAAMGCPPGEFQLGGRVIISDGKSVRNREGTLAGSVLTLDDAVRNLVEFTGCTAADAMTAASATPADAIGDATRGRLVPGSIADLVLLDQDLQVQITICAGKVAYAAAAARHRIPVGLIEPG
ncbi:MAG: N-acetylglucosamine-6-phosphate deacetylase [Acidimicrobiales bacterium]